MKEHSIQQQKILEHPQASKTRTSKIDFCLPKTSVLTYWLHKVDYFCSHHLGRYLKPCLLLFVLTNFEI